MATTTTTKPETLVGKRIRRREDPRLITGTATYVDDIKMPGMLMSSYALLQKNPKPSEHDIRWGISGNLCRCTGYQNIVRAVQYAAGKMAQGGTK